MSKPKKIRSRLKIIRRLLLCTLVLVIGFGYYYSFHIAPTDFKVTNRSITATNLPQEFHGFDIAFISDLNLKDEEDIPRLQKIVDTLNARSCDMVIFGGDLYDSQIFDNAKVIDALKDISSTYGKFAVYGEKDLVYANDVASILHEGGFEVLHNEYRKVYYKDSYIALFGLEANGDISGLLNDENKDTFKLVTVHEPDYFEQAVSNAINLQLSGHSLGGYIQLPFYGGVFKRTNAQTYINGSYTLNDSTLLISNGLGLESNHSFRFLSTNEILVITLENEVSQ